MKQYLCKKIDHDFIINGIVDKPEWKDIDEITLKETVTGEMPRQSTKVKMLWSEKYLYVAFRCEDNYINAAMTGYNDKIYNEEVVEIFIDDDNDLKTYIEIEVSPLNTLLHYSIHNTLKGNILAFARVDKKVDTAVYHDKDIGIWSVEMAIPFTEFVTAKNMPPISGDKWSINLYRIDRPENGEEEYSAWQPTGKIQFHRPDKFGVLIFT